MYSAMQGPKLRLTGRRCDQKLSVGDQNFKTGRRQATNLLSPRHLKFQGKRAFIKENIELPWTIVVKRSDDSTITTFTRRHIVSAASPNTDIAGENVTWRNRDGIESVGGNTCGYSQNSSSVLLTSRLISSLLQI